MPRHSRAEPGYANDSLYNHHLRFRAMAVNVRENAAVRAAVRVPAWAWVAGIVLVSALVHYALGRRIVSPWILIDELVYSDAAKSFAESGHLLLREHVSQTPGPVYPILVSPAWALFSAIPDAYAAAKAINALAISLTAVPAYLLGRRVLSQPLALVGAALSVAVPSMLYAGTIMTENAFYPLFLASAYALVLVLERPTFPRSAVLLALFVLTFLTRAQAVALIPAILTAPLVLVAFQRKGLRELKRFWLPYALTTGLVLLALVVQLARGHSVTGLFGRYSVVGGSAYPIGSVAKWFVYHLAELDLYVGVAPFAAVLLLVFLARGLAGRQQAFLAVAVTLTLWLVLVVAAVDQTYTSYVQRVAERNMFYVAPFLVIGLLLWIERGLPRPRVAAGIAAVVAAALPAVLPLQWMLNISIVSDALALIPWWRLDLALGSAGWTRGLLALACLLAAALFWVLPRRWWAVLPGIVLATFVAVTALSEREWHALSAGALSAIGSSTPDWVDRSVPGGSRVAVVYTGHVAPIAVWETEFFNRSLGDVYIFDEPEPGAIPETPVTVSRRGLLLAGGPVEAVYGLSDEIAPLHGARVGAAGLLTLYRLPGTLALGSIVRGLYPYSSWSGRHVMYTRFHCRGGRVHVGLASDPNLFITPKTVTVRTAVRTYEVRVPPSRPVETSVPLAARGGLCRVDFTVTPAPPLTYPKGSAPRPFGLQFTFG
jgi:Dolichyl-phosphate-mannose-protein mannosyltransferase